MIATPGDLIGGRYALDELLGVGGTGSVFAADDTRTGERVAVKLLHPHLCADAASRDAFLREAERASRLAHPNIAKVRGAGLHDAAGVVQPWIAMDLATGPTLRERVRDGGPLTPAEAGAVLDGVLAGLGHAHQAGIVHRDLTPQNVVLVGAAAGAPLTAAMVRIIDFGLADATGHSTVGHDVLLATTPGGDGGGVGVSGGVVGSAAFMSPEQATGKPVRVGSDLYQVGCVLYFVLTGQEPFPRSSATLTMQAHVSAPPPVPSALAPAARRLDRIVTRAMTKVPARRFRDAAEFREALAASAAVAPAVVAPAVPPAVVAHAMAAQAVAGPDQDETDPLAADRTSTGATRIRAGDPVRRGTLAYLTDPEPVAAVPATGRVPGNGPAVLGGVAVVALVVVVLVAAALAGSSASPGAGPDAAPAPGPSATSAVPATTPPLTPTPTPTPTVTPSALPATPTPVPASVPALHGTLADAEQALLAAGFRVGTITREDSAERAETVLQQRPAPGAQVVAGAVVDLTVASGRNAVPQVAGMSLGTATAVLETAGFLVAPQPSVVPADRTVTGSDPPAGTVLRVGVTISLVVQSPPTPDPTPIAHPATEGQIRLGGSLGRAQNRIAYG